MGLKALSEKISYLKSNTLLQRKCCFEIILQKMKYVGKNLM